MNKYLIYEENMNLILPHYKGKERETSYINPPLAYLLQDHGIDISQFIENNRLFLVDMRSKVEYNNFTKEEQTQFLLRYISRIHPQARIVAVSKDSSLLCTLPNEHGNYDILDIIRKNAPRARDCANNGWSLWMTECYHDTYRFPELRVLFVDTKHRGDGSLCYVRSHLAEQIQTQCNVNLFNYVAQVRILFENDIHHVLGKGTMTQFDHYYNEHGERIEISKDIDLVIDQSLIKNMTIKQVGQATINNLRIGFRFVFDKPHKKMNGSYVTFQHFSKETVKSITQESLDRELSRLDNIGISYEATRKALERSTEIKDTTKENYYVDSFCGEGLSHFMHHPVIETKLKGYLAGQYRRLFKSFGVSFTALVVHITPELPRGIISCSYKKENGEYLIPEGLMLTGRYPYIHAGSFSLFRNKHYKKFEHKLCVFIGIDDAQITGTDGDGDEQELFIMQVGNEIVPTTRMILEYLNSPQYVVELRKAKSNLPATDTNIAALDNLSTVGLCQHTISCASQHINGMSELQDLRIKLKTGVIHPQSEQGKAFTALMVLADVTQFNADVFKHQMLKTITHTDDSICVVIHFSNRIRHVFIQRNECHIINKNNVIFKEETIAKYHLESLWNDAISYEIRDIRLTHTKTMVNDDGCSNTQFELDLLSTDAFETTLELKALNDAKLFEDYSLTEDSDRNNTHFIGTGSLGYSAEVVSVKRDEHMKHLKTVPLQSFVNSLSFNRNERIETTPILHSQLGYKLVELIEKTRKRELAVGVFPIDLNAINALGLDGKKDKPKPTWALPIHWKDCISQAWKVDKMRTFEVACQIMVNAVKRAQPKWKNVCFSVAKRLCFECGHKEAYQAAINYAKEIMIAQYKHEGIDIKQLNNKDSKEYKSFWRAVFRNEQVVFEKKRWKEFAQIVSDELEHIRNEYVDYIHQDFVQQFTELTKNVDDKASIYVALWMYAHGYQVKGVNRYLSFLHKISQYNTFVSERLNNYSERECIIKIDDNTENYKGFVFLIDSGIISPQYHYLGKLSQYDYLPKGLYYIEKKGGYAKLHHDSKRVGNLKPILQANVSTVGFMNEFTAPKDFFSNLEVQYRMQRKTHRKIATTTNISQDNDLTIYIDCGSNGAGLHKASIIGILAYCGNELHSAKYMKIVADEPKEGRLRSLLLGIVATIETYINASSNIVIHSTLPDKNKYHDIKWLRHVAGYIDSNGKYHEGNGMIRCDKKPLQNQDCIRRLAEHLNTCKNSYGIMKKTVQITCNRARDCEINHPFMKLNRMIEQLEQIDCDVVYHDHNLQETETLVLGNVPDTILSQH